MAFEDGSYTGGDNDVPTTTDEATPLGEVIEALAADTDGQLQAQGVKIGKLYTNHGLPIDMALAKLEGYTKSQKLAILAGAQSWLIEHKRQSSAGDNAIERQRKTNREVLERFIKTGETGVY